MKLSIFLILVNMWLVQAALFIHSVKVGETLILDVGKDIKEWRRVKLGREERIIPCSSNVTKQCNIWIDNNSKNVGDGREHMYQNGTLEISNFQLSDEGDYYSNDELERVHYTPHGEIWQLAKTRISVYAIE